MGDCLVYIKHDMLHMGRSGMDLYSNDVGADFVHIK
jgi:hypothetical protein